MKEYNQEPVGRSRQQSNNSDIMNMLVRMKQRMRERDDRLKLQLQLIEEYLEAKLRRRDKHLEEVIRQRDLEWKEEIEGRDSMWREELRVRGELFLEELGKREHNLCIMLAARDCSMKKSFRGKRYVMVKL